MKIYLMLMTLAGLTLVTGCQEKAAYLTLNKDGSGTLLVRYAYDEMAGSNPANPPEASEPDEQMAEAKKTVEAMAARMGDVTFVSGKAITNARDWPGYEASYSFADINALKISFVDMEANTSVADMAMPLAPTYSFKYTPGGELEIDAETEKVDEAFDAAKVAPAKWIMMKGVFTGARETVLIKLEGSARESNADFIGGKNKDALLLFDFEIDKIEDASAMGKIEALRRGNGPEESLHLPGIKMQNPTQKTTVSF